MNITPMLARADNMPEGADWVYEPKIDGLRCIAYIRGGTVALVSRSDKPLVSFPDIEGALVGLPDCVLDGEICVLNEAGTAVFQLLQRRTNIKDADKAWERAKKFPAVFEVFDLLEIGDKSILDLPLDERKGLLRSTLDSAEVGPRIRYVVHHMDGEKLLAVMKEAGGEGLIAKNIRDTYRPGSRKEWVKVKFRESDEFVVVGWVEGTGWRKGGIGALLLAMPTSERFHYVAKVGTGFDIPMLDLLFEMLGPMAVEEEQVDNPPGVHAHWVKPELVVEVEFQLRTKDGSLRHPAFKGLRDDKKVSDLGT